MSTFYRVHRTDAGLLPFSAENAYSSLIDIPRNEDGTQSECQDCWDTDGPCDSCGGTGWIDCLPGYSCFEHPNQLLDYFLDPFHPHLADTEPVIVFEGRQVGTGFDYEPTAIPDRIVETIPWGDFRARPQDT